MVIRRRDTTTGQPVRRPLGHVSVNIDDLQALMELLRDRPEFSGCDEITIEFDEGDFTEAKDMKELGNQSLRDLRVKAGDLIVHLTSTRAEAIGPQQLVDFVDNAWARSRQTARYPDDWGWSRKYRYRSAPILPLFLVAGFTIYFYPQIQEPKQVLLFIALVLCFCF